MNDDIPIDKNTASLVLAALGQCELRQIDLRPLIDGKLVDEEEYGRIHLKLLDTVHKKWPDLFDHYWEVFRSVAARNIALSQHRASDN